MCERDSDTESSIATSTDQTSEHHAASNEYGGPTPPTYAHPRYAASDTPSVIWYDPRDNHEFFSRDLSTEIDIGERRVTSGKIGPYRPAEFGVPPEQYITKIGVQYGPEEGDEFPFPHSAVSSEVHDFLDAAQTHLAKVSIPSRVLWVLEPAPPPPPPAAAPVAAERKATTALKLSPLETTGSITICPAHLSRVRLGRTDRYAR